jgi:Carboxypeptidase regulatory-like domain/TonB-dependent Receptor Plug Domain
MNESLKMRLGKTPFGIFVSFCFLVLYVACTSFIFAQGSFGDLKGTVLDSVGGAVSGASVVVTNQGTNETRSLTTNEQGEFLASKLNVGSYTINVSLDRFANSTVKDVKVSVAFVTEQNVTLNPAGSAETVTITSSDTSTQVNTSDQQLSTLINNQKIMDLPLLSRDPSALVLLAPGTVQTDSGLGGFSVNGSRERNNNFLVDGVDNNDTDVPGIPGGIATPNIDATEEFRVITGNFNAEYGRNTGGIVTTATKRGTNNYHGNAYIYYRSDKFASRNFFDTTGKADSLDRKQFGGSLGGNLPFLNFGEGGDVISSGKDKLFFFFNYEGNRSKSGSQQYRDVPTALARTGILNTGSLYGTLDIRPTGANNQTAAFNGTGVNTPFSPTTTQILNLFPLPNYPVNGARRSALPGVIEIYTFGYNARDTVDSIAGRIDYVVNNKNTLSFSVNYGEGDYSLFAPTFDTFNDEARTPQKGGVYSINLLSNITSNTVNEFRFGTNRVNAFFNGAGDGTSSNALNQAVNGIFRNTGAPVSSFGNENSRALNLFTPFTSISNFDTQGRITGTTTLGDSFTLVSGSHTLKFGGEARFVYSDGQSNFGRQEGINFGAASFYDSPYVRDNLGRSISPTATDEGRIINDYLSFLSGLVQSQNQSQFFDKSGRRVANDLRRYRTTESGLFVQDTWRIRQDLTLNYGLRWEYNTVPYEKDGLLSNLIDQNPSLKTPTGGFVFKTVGKNSDNPDISLWDKDLNNFGPRFGFAYSPGFKSGILGGLFGGPGKSSFRGGYGIFYDRVFTNLFSNTSSNLPFSASIGTQPLDEGGNFPLTINQITRLGNATPTNTLFNAVSPNVGGSAVLFPTSRNNILQDKFATPNSMSFNFGYQREIGSSFLFEIDYVRTRGLNLIRDVNAQLTSIARRNALDPAANPRPFSLNLATNYTRGSLNTAFAQNSAFLIISTGKSEYNSMQVRVTKNLNSKRFGLGQFQAFYTLSHSIDDAPDALVTGTSDRSLPRDSSGFAGGLEAERGDSSFDARHRFVANFVYELPIKFENGILDRVFGNWTVSGIYQAQTGYPFSIFLNGIDTQGTGLSSRARYAVGSNKFADNRNAGNDRIYTGPNRSLFAATVPADGKQGNVGRSAFRGPKFSKTDFSLIKRIPITEKMRFTVRADFFNLFNVVNLNTPISNVLDPDFGISTSAGAARIIQFVGRFDF